MIQTIKASEHSNKIINAIKKDGAVIIEDILTFDDLGSLEADTDYILDKTENCNGYFYGFQTKRVANMVGKSAVCRKMATNKHITDIMDNFLLPHCDKYQLNLSQLISIGSGEKQQVIHADDPMFPFDHDSSLEAMVNVMWAIDDFTDENGATQVVPGSHLWERGREARQDEISSATMKRGSCVVWLGSVLHGGGANRTLTNRRGIVMSYNLGWLKQADNYFLSIPKEEIASYEPRLQELLGYFVHKPNLNMVEGRNPIELLTSGGLGSHFEEFLPENVQPLLKEHYLNQNRSISTVSYE